MKKTTKEKSSEINKPFNYKAFTEAAIAFRLDNNLYQQAMADKVGISRISLTRVESEKVLDLETIRKVCNTIGLPVQTFF